MGCSPVANKEDPKSDVVGGSVTKTRALLLYRGLLKSVQLSVQTSGRHQVVVGAHLGHHTLVNHADHVRVPYSGQTVGYGDARSALHGFVQGLLHDLRAQSVG